MQEAVSHLRAFEFPVSTLFVPVCDSSAKAAGGHHRHSWEHA